MEPIRVKVYSILHPTINGLGFSFSNMVSTYRFSSSLSLLASTSQDLGLSPHGQHLPPTGFTPLLPSSPPCHWTLMAIGPALSPTIAPTFTTFEPLSLPPLAPPILGLPPMTLLVVVA